MNNIYLCKPGGRMLGILNGIDENSATLKQSVADPWEISFDIYRYVAQNDEMVETDYYSSINEMMELYLTGDDANIFFNIDEEPQISGDGKTEKKTVHAHSIECEMSSKFLKTFKINCGTKDSQEYLLGYYDTDGNFRNLNLNPYTELPIDYIVVKNDYADQLQEVYNYLRTANLQVDPSNGMIRNSTYYDYLIDIYNRFPRICSHVYYNDAGESVCDVYLRVIENLESSYGYDIKVGLDGYTSTYTQEYFINGIYKLITYYREYGDQLSLVDLALQKAHAAGWSVGNIPDSIKGKKFTFNVDNKDILSFFKTECTSAMKVLFDFDRHDRQVDIIDIANEDEERDTGVLLTFRNLLNTVDVRSSSTDGIRTKYVPKGANNLGILYANFGENYILNMDWLMTKKNEYEDLQYVDDHLADEWYKWIRFREEEEYSFDIQNATLIYLSNIYFSNSNDKYSKRTIEETNTERKVTSYSYNGMIEESVSRGKTRREFTEDVAPQFTINNYIIHENQYMWKCTKYVIGAAQSVFDFEYIGDITDPSSAHYDNAINVLNNANKHYTCASRREAYMELTKLYNQCMIDIDAELNRMPNDGVFIDYTTFTFDELNIAYKAYVNALSTLVTLYKNDVGAVKFNAEDINYYDPVDEDLRAYDANGNECKSIKDTFYWLDYQCYKYSILPNVLNALTMYVQTDFMVEQEGHYMKCILNPDSPTQYDKDKEEWIQAPDGLNTQYTGDTKRVTENMSEAFLYEMGLYGVVELQAKQNAWRECAATIYKPGFVLDKDGNVVDPIPYGDTYSTNTPDDAGWNKLSHAQQEEFTNKDAFFRKLEEYLDYASTYERKNKLTWPTYEKNTKGVIAIAQDEIDRLQPGIDDMYEKQNKIQEIRKSIANEVMLDAWPGFTDYELRLIYEMIRESDYSNENILITNLDDIVTTVDAQEELYQDAKIALSETSCPQLEFQVSLDNLFAIDDFKPLVEQTKLLNYIRISMGLYEDKFIKLRIIGIEKNPLIPTEDLKLEFSNMTYSLQKMSDLAALFQGMSGGSSSGGSSSGGGGGGTYGSNDAEIQIANNMLNALLKSKTATSGMASVVLGQLANNSDYASLVAQSGLFQKLETGDLKVSGDCITDHIMSSNYIARTKGSYLGLKDGIVDYADGKIYYQPKPDGDGILYIDGGAHIGNTTLDDAMGEIRQEFTVADGELKSEITQETNDKLKNYSTITQTADAISTEVGKLEDVDGQLQSQISSVKETADGVYSTVWNSNGLMERMSTVEQKADKWSVEVVADQAKSKILVDPEFIAMTSQNIDLTGMVTFNDLSSNTMSGNKPKTIINGGNIYGGTLRLGGAQNGFGTLLIKGPDDSLTNDNQYIGKWGNTGIEIKDGSFSNGDNSFYNDEEHGKGAFSLGNGALWYDPKIDPYVHMRDKKSIMYGDTSLLGEDISDTVCWGAYLPSGSAIVNTGFDYDSMNRMSFVTKGPWKGFDYGYKIIIKSANTIHVWCIFQITAQLTKGSYFLYGLPPSYITNAHYGRILFPFIKVNKNTWEPDGNTVCKYGYMGPGSSYIKISTALAAGAWICDYTYPYLVE